MNCISTAILVDIHICHPNKDSILYTFLNSVHNLILFSLISSAISEECSSASVLC